MSALPTAATAQGKRLCRKCTRYLPIGQLIKRRTPSGGAIYLCKCCSKPRQGGPR